MSDTGHRPTTGRPITRNRISLTDAEIDVAGELLEWRNGCGVLVERLLGYCGWTRAEVNAEWDRLNTGAGPIYLNTPGACSRCRKLFGARRKPSATRPELCKACRGVHP